MRNFELFELLAATTWRAIERCNRNRIHLGEDAITTNNLDAIAVASPRSIVFEDTRVNESTKGCDFELLIGADSCGWTRYAVQAKKIQVPTSRYPNINHQIGRSGKLQIDVLRNYAKLNKAFPIYCFFNYSLKPYKWNCGLNEDVEQLGCSITPLEVVQEALINRGPRNFEKLHKQNATLPWRCLVKCPKFRSDKSTNIEGWSDLSKARYKRLPDSLRNLLNEVRNVDSVEKQNVLNTSFIDMPDVFNPDSTKRPSWIGIVDLQDEI